MVLFIENLILYIILYTSILLLYYIFYNKIKDMERKFKKSIKKYIYYIKLIKEINQHSIFVF